MVGTRVLQEKTDSVAGAKELKGLISWAQRCVEWVCSRRNEGVAGGCRWWWDRLIASLHAKVQQLLGGWAVKRRSGWGVWLPSRPIKFRCVGLSSLDTAHISRLDCTHGFALCISAIDRREGALQGDGPVDIARSPATFKL